MKIKIMKDSKLIATENINLIGEGVVFVGNYKDNRYMFKTKGNKYAGKTKIKKLKVIEEEKILKVNDCVNKITPIWRLEQFYNEIMGDDPDRKKIGDFIKSVILDIIKEDLDIINSFDLTVKEIGGKVAGQVKSYFFEKEKL